MDVRYEEAAEDSGENQRLDEEEEFAEMMRRMEVGVWPYEEVWVFAFFGARALIERYQASCAYQDRARCLMLFAWPFG